MPGPLRGYWNELDQRLDLLAALLRRGAARQRVAQRVRHRAPQIEALDALRRPVGRDLVAAHAPHLLGVGLEEDREQALAELVGHPVVKVLGVGGGEGLLVQKRQHAQRRFHVAQVVQRLEGLERIGEVAAVVIDARQARALDEVVGQNLFPEVDDLLGLGEEAVPADVEQEILVAGGAADAAHVRGIGLDHRGGNAVLGEQIGGGQPGRPRANDKHVRMGHGANLDSTTSAATFRTETLAHCRSRSHRPQRGADDREKG